MPIVKIMATLINSASPPLLYELNAAKIKLSSMRTERNENCDFLFFISTLRSLVFFPLAPVLPTIFKLG